MKKRIRYICIIGFLLCAACQPNPEQEMVVGKEAEKLKEAIHETKADTNPKSESAGENAVNETLLKPMQTETYQDSYPGAEDSVTITVNAELCWPEGDMAVLRVSPRTYTPEDVQVWAEALFEGNTAYAPLTVMKKSEVEEKILEIRQILGDEEALWANAADQEDYDLIRAYWEEELEAYEKAYESAPEKVQTQETDWQFHPRDYYDGAGLDGQMTCMVTAKIDNKVADLIVNNCEIEDLNSHNLWYSVEYGYETGELQTTEEEAITIIARLLTQTGYSYYVMRDCQKVENEYHSYYEFVYIPAYEGQKLLYVGQMSGLDDGKSNSAMCYHEEMHLRISDGRVVDMEWHTPMDVIAVENSAAQLLPVDEIKERIKEQMQIKYTLWKASNYDEEGNPQAAEVRIDKIECGLARIKVPDQEGEFYYIPAWGVYGEIGMDYGEGIRFMAENPDALRTPLLMINALDGSVIDTSIGY